MNLTENEIARFWRHATPDPNSGCWNWAGNLDAYGYATMWVSGKKRKVSHVSLILHGKRRPPPPSDHALHGPCDNRACVSPHHLRWGSNSENAADKKRRGRARSSVGSKHPNAKLTEDVVLAIWLSDEPLTQHAKRLGVTKALICHIKRGRAWNHVTGLPRFQGAVRKPRHAQTVPLDDTTA